MATNFPKLAPKHLRDLHAEDPVDKHPKDAAADYEEQLREEAEKGHPAFEARD